MPWHITPAWRGQPQIEGTGEDVVAQFVRIASEPAYLGLFGAFNAGPKRYTEHVERGRRLPGETRAYMTTVAGTIVPGPAARPNVIGAHTSVSIFFTLSASRTASLEEGDEAGPAGR